jgi:flagellar biosynthesis protein FlhG
MSDPVVTPIEAIIAETRQDIRPFVFKRLESRRPRVPGQKIARTITVTSGKGGVGKTNIVANMAIALGQAGRRVIILDADLGLANIDVVFGIRPKHSLNDVISGAMRLEEILIPGPCGVNIIAGGSGMAELAHLDPTASQNLFEQLRFLEDRTDYLLIDTGAGISRSIISFCLAADQIVVVTNPEPTALADAYGIIKIISQERPLAHVSLLVNRADSEQEGRFIQERLRTVAAEFLQFPVHDLGYLPQDPTLYLAVRQQTPLLLFSPMSPAAVGIRRLVTEGLHENMPSPAPEATPETSEGFFGRLSAFFRQQKELPR